MGWRTGKLNAKDHTLLGGSQEAKIPVAPPAALRVRQLQQLGVRLTTFKLPVKLGDLSPHRALVGDPGHCSDASSTWASLTISSAISLVIAPLLPTQSIAVQDSRYSQLGN